MVWIFFVLPGLERRLLAGRQWRAATAVAFPQKSESLPAYHEKPSVFKALRLWTLGFLLVENRGLTNF
jgi:hypothetical protein